MKFSKKEIFSREHKIPELAFEEQRLTSFAGAIIYQVEDNIRAKKVIAEKRIGGSIVITCKSNAVKFKEIETRHKEPLINSG